MSKSQAVYKLPFRFDSFTQHEGRIHASLKDDNGVIVQQGEIADLLGKLPVSKSQISNLKFAYHVNECPDAADIKTPLVLTAEFGSARWNRQNNLYLTLNDANGNVVISADAAYIKDAVLQRGYEVSKESIQRVHGMVTSLQRHQKVVGVIDRNFWSDMSRYSV